MVQRGLLRGSKAPIRSSSLFSFSNRYNCNKVNIIDTEKSIYKFNYFVNCHVSLLEVREKVTTACQSTAVKVRPHREIVSSISISIRVLSKCLLTGEERYVLRSCPDTRNRRTPSHDGRGIFSSVLSMWFGAPSGNCPRHSHNRGAQSEHENDRKREGEKVVQRIAAVSLTFKRPVGVYSACRCWATI